MQNWYLRDDGVSIEYATAMSGYDSARFVNGLCRDGALGRGSSLPDSRASLLQVAAIRALFLAEMAGVPRPRALPVITQMADAAYVELARMELKKRSWDPRHASSHLISELAQKMYSDEGLIELQDRLGVGSRNAERYTIFTPEGVVFAGSPPEPDANGRTEPFVDVWKISQHIHNKVDTVLFHGARKDSIAA
jgi:hypothetical protein